MALLSGDWKQRKAQYDFIVVGSGYGGAITAARLANAPLNPKPSVCILERGQEWPVGKFPDALDEVIANNRRPGNPLGLYELLTYRDISVIKGSGLGGTSLINANVAIVPDPEMFSLAGWPRSLNYESLLPYYERAHSTLDASPHPRADQLLKVQALDRRAQQIGARATPLNLAVNFDPDKKTPLGDPQPPCNDCGDCVTGCNYGSKNTLYMNYLPLAKKGGAEIYTQIKVEWIEKLSGGGWRVHGRYQKSNTSSERFTLEAANVILAAGSINSTEILMRSEMRGLKVSPRLGSGFSGNGDFFGLAYNGDHRTNTLGLGRKVEVPGAGCPPGPTIVAALRYNGKLPVEQRIVIEDLSFPSAYTGAAKTAFALMRGEDTDIGDEPAERTRVHRDLTPFAPNHLDGALNHTMLYLCMGYDDARGDMVFDAPWHEPDGRLQIEWDDVGRQVVFNRINEELRRHAQAQGAAFISNPAWAILNLRHLITAHPIGGCPIGEDYMHGAVDQYGRLFSNDGSVHNGLFVADGALIPSSLGVNPFLTISALAEHIAERKIRDLGGDAYPAPPASIVVQPPDPLEAIHAREGQLEKMFKRLPSLGIDVMLNSGVRTLDPATRTIRNDEFWKGFFPKGHILNAMSSAIFTGFQKRFFRAGAAYAGLTSDTDGNIRARNTLEEVTITEKKGDLDPGKYILLRYTDPPWQGYYDVFKVISDDLLIGRVYLGSFPHGLRLFTFPMTRVYTFNEMTVMDHGFLWAAGTVPTKQDMAGVWRMDVVSNANHLAGAAHLSFQLQPDGRLESRYQLMGLIEGMVIPSFLSSHFQLTDFTPFHDEIRMITPDFLAGKYVMDLPAGFAALFPAASLGILHTEGDSAKRFGFYYTLTKTDLSEPPTNRLLDPFLNVHLPSGLGMTFDEEMEGWYWPAALTTAPGREGDLEIARRVPREGRPDSAGTCSFKLRMTVRDLNEFIEGAAHEAGARGTISFEDFLGQTGTFTVDERTSRFQYLVINQETAEAEMRYHLEFTNTGGQRFVFEGRKYMQKDEALGPRGMREALQDFTTLYCHVFRKFHDSLEELGTAYLKFRTFEDLRGVRNLTDFLRSFKVTGTPDPLLQLQGQMRFLAFTWRFLQREYDPLAPEPASVREDVRTAVQRGAEIPDYFVTRSSSELQAILRETPTRPLESLLNTGAVRIDFDRKRIFRDSFWKGSFARDTILGWEERIRTSLFAGSERVAGSYTGGSFWKRIDRIENGQAFGHVVNYEIELLPGKPVISTVAYPDNRRAYFKQGDDLLLLKYTNDPYRIVYDTIKVIDDDSAIGVMHLGDFPNGMEFATFVMERHNYPFEKMSVADHHAIFRHARTRVPAAADLLGTWEGRLILLANPSASLANQINPVLFRLTFDESAGALRARYRFGLAAGESQVEFTDEFLRLSGAAGFQDEIRLIDRDMMIGNWSTPDLTALLLQGLQDFLEPARGRFSFYYVLNRV
ncbi:MAG: GMC family oxidoreductase [Bryobacteraceae bacterium]|nr:GMC family oxidoreductase [Bryobacteraceae bacterium]